MLATPRPLACPRQARSGPRPGECGAALVASALAVTAPLLAAPARGTPGAPAGGPIVLGSASASTSAIGPALPCRSSAVKGGPLRLRSRERATRVRDCQNTAASAEREGDVPGEDRLESFFADAPHYKPGARVRSLEPSVRGWVAAAREVPTETVEVVVQYAGSRREAWGQAARFSVAVTRYQADSGMCHDWTTTEKLRGALVLRDPDGAIVSLTLAGSGQHTEAVCRPPQGAKGPAQVCSTSQLDVTLDRACKAP